MKLQRLEPLKIQKRFDLHGQEYEEVIYPAPCEEAQKLRKIRGERGITLGNLARYFGLKVHEVSGLETGRFIPEFPYTWEDLLDAAKTLPARFK